MQQNITFEQIPSVLGEILSKIDYVISKLNTPSSGLMAADDPDQLMTLEQACSFIGKKPSTIYAMTSERRIPFMKRGNKLYFMKRDLLEWIKTGGCYDAPYNHKQEDTDFDAHLRSLSAGKKHKPASAFIAQSNKS